MNYYKIEKVSYTQVAFKELDDYGLIKPYKTSGLRPVNTLK